MVNMLKKICVPLALLGFFLFISPPLSLGQQTVMHQERVIYNLPYPGLLPDHPLYFLKAIRDRFLDMSTRDYLKKAELYLLLSDKRVAMALALADEGKDNLAVSTLSKAEKYFLKIPPLLQTSRKQGVTATAELVDRFKLSNAKHRMVASELLKKLPQGRGNEIKEIMDINAQIKSQLQKL